MLSNMRPPITILNTHPAFPIFVDMTWELGDFKPEPWIFSTPSFWVILNSSQFIWILLIYVNLCDKLSKKVVPKMEAQKLSTKHSQNGSPKTIQKKFPKWKPKVSPIKWRAEVWQTFTEQTRTQSINYKIHSVPEIHLVIYWVLASHPTSPSNLCTAIS